MNALTEALRDAAEDAPTRLGDDGDPGTTWRRGRRRRLASAVGAGATLVVVLGLLAGVLLTPFGAPRAAVPAGPARDGVASYPQRIGHQWWVRDLPSSGTPVAGVLSVVDGDEASWQAVSADGTRYDLPGSDGATWPAVSDDGTRVGYLTAGEAGSYRVLDLVTGRTTAWPQVGTANLAPGDAGFLGGRPYGVGNQYPGFFSPDGARLAVGGHGAGGWGGILVLEAGRATEVPGMDMAAGWVDADRLLGRVVDASANRLDGDGVRIVVWDARTGLTRPLGTLQVPAPAGSVNELNGQWWGQIRRDGTLWAAYEQQPEDLAGSHEPVPRTAGWRLPDLEPVGLDGRPDGDRAPTRLVVPPQFGLAWAGDRPATLGEDTMLQVAVDGGGPLVVAEGSVTTPAVVWAQDALDGGPTWTPFGTSTSRLAWWWREVVLAAVAALGGWWLRRRWVRRPRPPAAERSVLGGRVTP